MNKRRLWRRLQRWPERGELESFCIKSGQSAFVRLSGVENAAERGQAWSVTDLAAQKRAVDCARDDQVSTDPRKRLNLARLA